MRARVAAVIGMVVAVAIRLPAQALVPLYRVPLPQVGGRIDHMGIDPVGGRLFVAALGNGTVEVIDLRSRMDVHRIESLQEPQGVYYSPSARRLYVANAGSGTLEVFDGTSLALRRSIELGGDADNIHADEAVGQLLVSAANAVSILDLAADRPIASVGLPGHPEGFAVEEHGSRVFVNVPFPSGSVFVLDRVTKSLDARWAVGAPRGTTFSNFPMALDERDSRLFVGTRAPAALRVLDSSSGRVVTDVATDGDADDISYDAARHRLYVSCGQGFIDVFQQVDRDHYRALEKITTAPGARTSLWEAEMNLLFVAVPRRGGAPAEIRVFEAH